MGVIESIKRIFVSEGKDVYQCDDCGETLKVAPETPEPECAACGSNDLTVINRV